MAELPKEVREAPTSQTSIYRQGELIYDGATGSATAAAASASNPEALRGGSMNELLSWGIRNSDPAELKRRADAGETHQLTPLDKEMLEMLLGQPTVAQMRAGLAKLEPEPLHQEGGEEAALDALEELEFHCEDLDNANDLVKIGGLATLLQVCDSAGAEVKEAACGVLAAGMQNNPPFQQASVALGVPAALLRLLDASQPLPVRRKALYALSALLRAGGDATATILALDGTMPALLRAAASADAKEQRRALFLLLVLVREGTLPPAPLAAHAGLGPALLGAACGEDAEAQESAVQLLLLLRSADALRAQLAAELEAEAKVTALLEAKRRQQAQGEELHESLLEWLGLLLSWCKGEPWRPGLGVTRPQE
jgi:hypothetical protein